MSFGEEQIHLGTDQLGDSPAPTDMSPTGFVDVRLAGYCLTYHEFDQVE
jgi:hypothetical protein